MPNVHVCKRDVHSQHYRTVYGGTTVRVIKVKERYLEWGCSPIVNLSPLPSQHENRGGALTIDYCVRD